MALIKKWYAPISFLLKADHQAIMQLIKAVIFLVEDFLCSDYLALRSAWTCQNKMKDESTEVLHLEDVIPFFCAHPSNLGNYWADCVQIRHGGSFLQYILNYRGDFLIFHPWAELRAPLGAPLRGQDGSKIFFLIFKFFLYNRSLQCLNWYK